LLPRLLNILHLPLPRPLPQLLLRRPDTSEAFGNEHINYVQIGDILVDAEGVEWLCRSCFCREPGYYGKTIVRLERKDEADGWDRGGNLGARRRVYTGEFDDIG
jgi:hypothetical protein